MLKSTDYGDRVMPNHEADVQLLPRSANPNVVQMEIANGTKPGKCQNKSGTTFRSHKCGLIIIGVTGGVIIIALLGVIAFLVATREPKVHQDTSISSEFRGNKLDNPTAFVEEDVQRQVTVTTPSSVSTSTTKATTSTTSTPLTSQRNASERTRELPCETMTCLETAWMIRKSINPDVNPCDNFYEFACGRYSTEIKTASVTNPHEEMIHKYNGIIEGKLNSISKVDDHPIVKYAKKVYSRCLISIRSDETENVRNFIRQTMGVPWPLNTAARVYSFRNVRYLSEKTAEIILSNSVRALFGLQLTMHSLEDEDSDTTVQTQEKFLFKVLPPTFEIPFEIKAQFGFQVFTDQYIDFVTTLMKNFGTQLLQTESFRNFKPTEQEIIAKEVVDFELELYKLISLGTKSKSSQSSEEFTVLSLENILKGGFNIPPGAVNSSELSIRHTIDYILYKAKQNPIRDEDSIFVYNSTTLSSIIKLVSRTRIEVVTNYVGYRLAMELIPYSPRLSSIKSLVNQNSLLSSEVPTRTKKGCLDLASEIFSEALTRYSSEDPSPIDGSVGREIRNIFLNIREELISIVNGNTWLKQNRKEEAVKGLNSIKTCQDNWMLNDYQLTNYYNGIETTKNSYIDQFAFMSTWKQLKEYKHYGSPLTNACDFKMKTSAFYVPLLHQMNIPPPFWLKPFYSQDWPAYLKYSGVADTTGHEIIHSMFHLIPEWIQHPNPKGKFKTSSENADNIVTTKQLLRRFKRATAEIEGSDTAFRNSKCFIDHYDNYVLNSTKYTSALLLLLTDKTDTVPKINGTRTFEENVCDIGGIQLAYSAYKSFLSKSNPRIVEKGLPGLSEFSNDQLFYLNYARKWCDVETEMMNALLLDTDEHSPPEFRVLGVLRNNLDFARAYNCPVGSFMNPVKKCPLF